MDNSNYEPIQKDKITALKSSLRFIIDVLDDINDTTYARVNDFSDPDHGRYADMLDWLQYLG